VLGPESSPLATLRGTGFDAYQRLAPRPRVSGPVLIVAIDDASLKAHGQWPWPRTTLVDLIERIARGRPAAIGLDIVMPEADRLGPVGLAALVATRDPELAERLRRLPSGDAELGATVARRRVVVGMIGGDAGAGGSTRPLRHTPVRVTGSPGLDRVRTFGGVLRSDAPIDAGAAGHGLVNATGERIERRLPVVARVGDVLVPSLGVEMLRVAVGADMLTVRAERGGVRAVRIGDVIVPTQLDGSAFVPYGHPDDTRYVSAASLLSDRAPPTDLEGSLVLIGVTADLIGDVHVTPLAARTPGIEIHAQWLEAVFDGRLLVRPAWAPPAEAAALLAAGVVLVLALPAMAAWSSVLLVLAFLIVLPAAGLLAYWRGGILLDAASPTAGVALIAATLLLAMLAEAQRQRRVLREEAAKIEGELDAARRIQMGLLPTRLTAEDRLDVYAFLQPARMIGGDLYDFFKLDADRLFFVVADVSGHGVAASLFMAVSKALCKSAALRRGDDLGQIIRDVDTDISRDNPEAFFVSVWAGVLNVRTGELAHCNAGHEPAWLVGPGVGPARVLTAEGGPPLCVVDGFRYEAASYRMRPGETICLVTDGVTEAPDPSRGLYGRQRLSQMLSRVVADGDVEKLGEAIRSDVASFMAGTPPADDLTILILRWRGDPRATLSEP
jgi:serine phosphatase RsbU (regulator of sigma subunit)/CHASE2 domain-containing sensor protein